MGNKAKIAKCPLRTKTGHILKSTQDTCIGSEKLLQKKTVGSETSQAKGEKNGMTFSSTKDLCKQCIDKDCLHIQKEISPATPNMQKTRNTVNTSLVGKQKLHKKHITAENMKSSLVCLTQDQLQQILMTVNQGNGSLSLTENGKEAKSQYSLHLNSISNQPKDENIMGLFKKTEMVSFVPAENKSVLNEHQETSKQCEQKIAIENEWKPADIFSTLGERERDRNSLEAKKAQWRKELALQAFYHNLVARLWWSKLMGHSLLRASQTLEYLSADEMTRLMNLERRTLFLISGCNLQHGHSDRLGSIAFGQPGARNFKVSSQSSGRQGYQQTLQAKMAGLKLLSSGDPPASASQVAGITSVHHCIWPSSAFFVLFRP
ncbi:coiled-coil domain-containing protein 66-like isoform X3 [Hylobates moloch]|nr:coiled-coil domain-containing protein 66-like isoform X3 [Hylobates moloch]XP_058298489.1 coiled-coil domain-containing protein 66-like isoform X3 [Hylobates moloch]